MIKTGCYLLLILSLFGCSSNSTNVRSKTAPDWVSGESALYPHSGYVTATGSAAEPERAKDRAMGNLAKVFEAHIVESSTTRTDTQTALSGGVEAANIQKSLAQRISVRADKILEGIRVAALWQSSADLTYHALAVIDRHKAGTILRDRINKLDTDTAFELESIPDLQDDLKRIAAYERVINMQKTRNNIQKTLKVIDLKGKGLPPLWSMVELTSLANNVLSQMRIAGDVRPGERSGLKQLLQAAMSQAGFTAVSGVADYTLVAVLDMQAPSEEQGWHWLRGDLSVQLIDEHSRTVRGRHSWPIRVSATQSSQLTGRFNKAIELALKNDLKAILIGIANSE